MPHQLFIYSTNHVARGPTRKSAEDIVARGDFDIILRLKITDCGRDWMMGANGQVRRGKCQW